MFPRTALGFALIIFIFALLAPAFAVPLAAQSPFGAPSAESATTIPTEKLLQPDELNRMLRDHGAQKPLVLQVGSHVMFAQAHIPGSEYAGPGSQPAGLEALERRVAKLPHDTFIVIYCGCCPWNRCPNMGPAFHRLHDLGFTRVRALYLADNFGTDWVSKGYPVEASN